MTRLQALAIAALVLLPCGVPSPAQAAGRTERAVLAGGCFWGMQAVFEQLRGVKGVVAGFAGGKASTAHYELVSMGNTGHAESVEISYDPAIISYRTLLDVYFGVAHDPTELDYQGPDHGPQYRSAIFYTTPDQRRVAEQTIRELTSAKRFPAPIVTRVVPFTGFYAAEAYHQDYAAHHPDEPYIVINDEPKLAALRQRYPALLRSRT